MEQSQELPTFKNKKAKPRICYIITDLEGFIGFIEGESIFKLRNSDLQGANFFQVILTEQSRHRLLNQFNGELLPSNQQSVEFQCQTAISNTCKLKKQMKRFNGSVIQTLKVTASRIYISFAKMTLAKRQIPLLFYNQNQFDRLAKQQQNLYEFIFLEIQQQQASFQRDIFNFPIKRNPQIRFENMQQIVGTLMERSDQNQRKTLLKAKRQEQMDEQMYQSEE